MARAKVSTKGFSIPRSARAGCREGNVRAHRYFAVEVSTPATTWSAPARKRFSAVALMPPDEFFDDGGLLGIEGMQVRIGLPFLEQELHLPAQAIGLGDFIDRVASGGRLVAKY